MCIPTIEKLIETLNEAKNTIITKQRNSLKITGKLVTLPSEGEVLILGDLHGDYRSLKKILNETNFENRVRKGDHLYLICLGDYIDRGPSQIQVIHTLLNYMNFFPNNVILLRGNHEGPADLPVIPHDFPHQLGMNYGIEWEPLYTSFKRIFNIFVAFNCRIGF